jgi:hypothetical protein
MCQYSTVRMFVCIKEPFTKSISHQDVSHNISDPTMRTGLDFKSAQFDQVRGEAEDPDWIKMR